MLHDENIGTKQLRIVSYLGIRELFNRERSDEEIKEFPRMEVGSERFNNWVDELSSIISSNIKELIGYEDGFPTKMAETEFKKVLKSIASFAISEAKTNIARHSSYS